MIPETNRKRVAIIIPAHNEERVIHRSLVSAIVEVGREHTYVVSDNSTDNTIKDADFWTDNILEVKRGGKAKAIQAGIDHFNLIERYDYVLVLDADSRLVKGSLKKYMESFREGVAAVIGNLKVLKEQRGLIAAWRRNQYFWMTSVYMNGADFYGGGFPVTPGFCTAYSIRALKRFEHDPHAPTEDIDYCWQIHRNHMGKIVYNPEALVETDVPTSFRDYLKQNLRWNRGWHHVIRKYKMPFGFQAVDLIAGMMTLEMLLVWVRIFLIGILLILGIEPHWEEWNIRDVLILSFGIDFVAVMGLGVIGSFLSRNFSNLKWVYLFPAFFLLDQVINLYAAINLKRGRNAIWQSPRR